MSGVQNCKADIRNPLSLLAYSAFKLYRQLLHQFWYCSDFPDFAHPGTTEDQTVIKIAHNGIDQCLRDAVRGCGRIACFQTVEAVGDFVRCCKHTLDKRIFDSAAGHSEALT